MGHRSMTVFYSECLKHSHNVNLETILNMLRQPIAVAASFSTEAQEAHLCK